MVNSWVQVVFPEGVSRGSQEVGLDHGQFWHCGWQRQAGNTLRFPIAPTWLGQHVFMWLVRGRALCGEDHNRGSVVWGALQSGV